MSNGPRSAIFAALCCLAAPLVSTLAAQTAFADSPRPTAASAAAAAVAPAVAPAAALAVAPTDSFAAPLAPVGATSKAAVDGPATVGTAFASHTAVSSGSQNSHNTALMIVGGAALLAGALVGGKAGGAIMVGGAVIGLVGLWRYLQ